ncbi:unnamed protein product [Mytilus coruscus]|uniref:Mab-21-like HhH/H2TH-like domain-containing protein n=1 Tax=Mytilus coruscus TaxID=42192 RepID=A0A6J8DTH3_MYTCO|nr:unnamed protein product [Mytilus coruscus]
MDTDKDVCRRLYHCLCETIGPEVVEKVRRQFYASVDHFAERKDFTLISSGSRAEGLEMGSDVDVMCLLKFVNVSEERTDDSFLIPNNFVMETDDCKPCFTQLKGNSCHYNSLAYWISTPQEQGLSLESGRIRYLFLSIIRPFNPMILHGPCASDNDVDGLCDITICLRCPVWIKQAQSWIKRVRYWPPQRVVTTWDAVSCWMYLATYYYCIGQYTTSLQLIFHALKQCTPDKIFFRRRNLYTRPLSTIEKEGIRRKIWKSRHLYKHHVINEISFYYNSRVIPPELDVQTTTLAYIPPIVYIHFLRFLCFYRLQEDSLCMQAIRDLRTSVTRRDLNHDIFSVGEAYHCLAVALLIFGQKKEARYYFAKSNVNKEKCKDIYF